MEQLEWYGFKMLGFDFNGRQSFLVIPDNPHPDGKWMLKTEYFGAFPELELELLRRGLYPLEHGRGPGYKKRIYKLYCGKLWPEK